MFLLSNLLIPLSLLGVVHGLHNITIDDNSSMIQYTGDWFPDSAQQSPLDYGGAHTLTQDPTAKATFTFTGVAVYFMSPLWPYTVNTELSLDSEAPDLVDLTDHSRSTGGGAETVQSQVVWGRSGLANTTHTLVASVGQGQPYAVVDAIIYTVLDASDNPASVTSSTSSTVTSATSITPSSTSVASHTTSTANHTLAIAVGSVCGVVGLAAIAALLIFCGRRRAHQKPEMENRFNPGIYNIYSEQTHLPPKPSILPPPPATLAYSTHADPTNVYHAANSSPQVSQLLNPWPNTTPPLAQSESNQYQANTLSTGRDSSQSSYGGAWSLPNEPAVSTRMKFGDLPGTQEIPAVAWTRPSSSYQASYYTGQQNEISSGNKRILAYEPPDGTIPPPPAYGTG